MRTASPLRYPGGKSALAGLLTKIRRINRLGNRSLAEPFAGGAGASLSLLFQEEAPEILVNDADRAVHDFWWSLVNRPRAFAKLVIGTRVSMAEWRRQRDTYRSPARASRLKRGFAAFYLNRCNRSGIIMNGGPIGGIAQSGPWKLNARFNRVDLDRRCQRVGEYGSRIRVSCQDGIHFIRDCDASKTLFFIDPPYFVKGPMLYLNALDASYHLALSKQLRSMASDAWVLTYDDCVEIRHMYEGWANVRPFTLQYAAAERRSGREVLVTPKWMQLPDSQTSTAVVW